MAKDKEPKRLRFFASVPAEVIYDTRLTALELRALMAIAWHDGMSGTAKGSGPGCYAAHKNLAALISTDATNFSKAKNKLLGLGYIVEEPQQIDKKRNTLRVVYNETADLVGETTNPPAAKVGEMTNRAKSKVGDGNCENGGFSSDSGLHYIPLKEELHSVETGKDIPLNGATHSHCASTTKDSDLAVKLDGKPWETQLAMIEREIVKGRYDHYDLPQWRDYVWSIHNGSDELHIMGQAERIGAEIEELMSF